jgi:hypothetical protein
VGSYILGEYGNLIADKAGQSCEVSFLFECIFFVCVLIFYIVFIMFVSFCVDIR